MSKQESQEPDKGALGFLSAARDAVQAIAPGLSLEKIGADVGPVLDRMATQGAAELGAALFQGHSYVPYGDGQEKIDKPQPEQQKGEQEHDGHSL